MLKNTLRLLAHYKTADIVPLVRSRIAQLIKYIDARDIDTALGYAKQTSRVVREWAARGAEINPEIADYIDIAIEILEKDPRYINEPKTYIQEAMSLTGGIMKLRASRARACHSRNRSI